jgi:hypothetical protein
MTLSFAEHIETTRNKIAKATSLNVKIGMPDDLHPGLYLFPYQFSVDPQLPVRNLSTRQIESQINAAYYVKCLLIPNPSNDYASLNAGLNYICSNPVLQSSTGRVSVIPENVSTEELTSLFISAGVTYRLSIPFQMHFVASA